MMIIIPAIIIMISKNEFSFFIFFGVIDMNNSQFGWSPIINHTYRLTRNNLTFFGQSTDDQLKKLKSYDVAPVPSKSHFTLIYTSISNLGFLEI